MARLEGAYEQINHRIGSLWEEVRELRREVTQQIGELRDRMDQQMGELRREIRTQFYWVLGLLIPMWVTIILAVLLK
jgi:tetrahydromethanopterin S-methyltransferase subunit G